jgi:hypothetical protein
MTENQEQRNQANQHEGGLKHTTRAARQDQTSRPRRSKVQVAPTVRGNRSAEVGRPGE